MRERENEEQTLARANGFYSVKRGSCLHHCPQGPLGEGQGWRRAERQSSLPLSALIAC